MALRRIRQEYVNLQREPVTNVTAAPVNPDNVFEWKAILLGPPDTPYAGGSFHLEVNFTKKYPYEPPRVRFITRVYHPNINASGSICLDILKPTAWSPALTIGKVLLSISALLCDPNPDDPLVPDIAHLYKNDRASFNETAKQWTQAYARPNPPPT